MEKVFFTNLRIALMVLTFIGTMSAREQHSALWSPGSWAWCLTTSIATGELLRFMNHSKNAADYQSNFTLRNLLVSSLTGYAVNLATIVIHEFAHYLAAKAVGSETSISDISINPIAMTGTTRRTPHASTWRNLLVDSAGPGADALFTCLISPILLCERIFCWGGDAHDILWHLSQPKLQLNKYCDIKDGPWRGWRHAPKIILAKKIPLMVTDTTVDQYKTISVKTIEKTPLAIKFCTAEDQTFSLKRGEREESFLGDVLAGKTVSLITDTHIIGTYRTTDCDHIPVPILPVEKISL